MKNKFPLIFSIIVGGIALLAIRSYVNNVEKKAQEQLKGDPVVTAKADIPKGTVLTLQMLTAKPVPRQFIPPQAVQGSQEVKQILNRRTQVPIKAGQLILWTDLAKESAGGVSTAIAPDQRAYTASISKGIKPGLIAVSDHVDIIGSFSVPKSAIPVQATAASWKQSPDMVNVVLLQDVTVLAVGDVTSGMNRSEGTMGDLTFALTLPEAQLLMFAAEHGELGVVLRSQGSADVVPRKELKRITFDSIEQIIGDLDGRRSQRLVSVQRGTDVEVVPVRSTTPDLATPLEAGGQK